MKLCNQSCYFGSARNHDPHHHEDIKLNTQISAIDAAWGKSLWILQPRCFKMNYHKHVPKLPKEVQKSHLQLPVLFQVLRLTSFHAQSAQIRKCPALQWTSSSLPRPVVLFVLLRLTCAATQREEEDKEPMMTIVRVYHSNTFIKKKIYFNENKTE